MNPYYTSQVLVGIAFLFGLTAVQFKERRSVLLCLFVSTVFNASHFLMLERPGAAALIALTGVRYLIAIRTTDRRVMYVFLCISVVLCLLTFRSALSLLALFAVLVGTYGSFRPTDRVLRIYLMIGNSTWLLHNLLSRTLIGVIMEASFLSSNVIGYWRHYLAPQPAAEPDRNQSADAD